MKKLLALFLIVMLLIGFSTIALAEDIINQPDDFSFVMAINEEAVLANNVQCKITAPLMVFDKTYVELFETAPLMGINTTWIDGEVGFSRAFKNEKTIDFTLAFNWDELKNQKYKFFVKNSKIYVSLRELNELSGYNITYDEGVITLGNNSEIINELYSNVDIRNSDDYVYINYPVFAEYVINPYQKYGYENMLSDIEKLKYLYPELVKTSSIGQSVEGRELLLVEFGRGDKKIFVCGTHHAREYITTTYIMYAIDRYAYAYRYGGIWGEYNVKEILDNVTFVIVPMVNPDGVNLVINGLYATKNPELIAAMGIYEGKKYGYSAWKANVHGVDLNWNYDKDWSFKKNKNKRGSVGFNGDYPNSEPETIAISDYVDNNPFSAYVSFHAQGEIFYWADNPDNPSNINNLIEKDTGFKEYTDNGEGVGGSFFDYVYRKYKKPTLTIELCHYIGNYPYPDKDFDDVWKPAKNVLLIVGREIMNKN